MKTLFAYITLTSNGLTKIRLVSPDSGQLFDELPLETLSPKAVDEAIRQVDNVDVLHITPVVNSFKTSFDYVVVVEE